MKIKFILLPLLLVVGIVTAFRFFSHNAPKHVVLFSDSPYSDGGDGNADDRYKWELMRLADPVTGKIPDNIRAKELAFAATLPKYDFSFGQRSAVPVFSSRGPWNVGGRTRSVAFDVTNDGIVFSGSVDGGLWRSIDRGVSWTRVSSKAQIPAISCIVQDKRAGHTNTWYYGTGEGTGASASGGGSYYLGNGIYKSTDGGLTWDSLASTFSKTPQFVDTFDLNWDLALDISDTAHDVIYAATTFYGIRKSMDGGSTWKTDLKTTSYFTDVKVSTTGIAYASASSDGVKKGIWRKQDSTWTKISPPNWDTTIYNRYVIDINPSNENEVYFLGGNTPFHGQETTRNFGNITEWNSLWKYTYMGGNGDSSGGVWTDLSQNIPKDSTTFGSFNSQGGYDLLVKVHPDSSNIVYIGGTDLYRSTDGFTSSNNTRVIGGYNIGSTLPFYKIYPDHHPDQHNLAFLPSNHDVMISTCDGGVFKTMNDRADSVIWQSLNNGYVTTQFYSVAIDHGAVPNNIVIGGTQDFGSWFTNNTTLTTPWTNPGAGDGGFCFIDNGYNNYYLSRDEGVIAKATLDTAGNVTAFRRIDPIDGLSKGAYLFINPFIIDPNNNNAMFMSAGGQVWRNDSLSAIALTNQWDSISQGWFVFPDSLSGVAVTALAMSKNPAGILYYGTSRRRVFRVDSPYSATPVAVEITSIKNVNAFPASGYVNCIAIDPTDANKIIVVFSNYSVYSLFYSDNGGTTWIKIGGNLEPADGTGPSVRWASIIPVASGNVYLVGTSIGLFGTSTLDTLKTVWTQLDPNGIGNMVVDMIDYRASDGLVAIATHGGGIYTANITDVLPIGLPNLTIPSLSVTVYPNPATTKAVISFSLNKADYLTIKVFDIKGALVETLMQGKLEEGAHQFVLDRKNMSAGVYFVNIKTGNGINETRKVVFRD